MNSGLYSVLYLTYFIILDSVLYFADIECGFSHEQFYLSFFKFKFLIYVKYTFISADLYSCTADLNSPL